MQSWYVSQNLHIGINSRFIFRYEMVSLGSGKVEKLYSVDTMTGSRSSGHGRIPRFSDKVYKSFGTFVLIREGSIGVITSVVMICCENGTASVFRRRVNPETLQINSPSIVPKKL
jgi:hypothetical protein